MCTIRCCQRGWRRGTNRWYRRRDDPPPASSRRTVGEGGRFGPGEPVRERARGGVLGRQQRLVDRPGDRQRRVVPADPALVRAVVRRRAEVLDLGRVVRAPRSRARTRPGPRPGPGRRPRPRAVTTCPSVGEPGRMSAATRNALPATTRMSLPCGGSHWKCRPRTTPRADRDWFTCSNLRRQPEARRTRPAWRISANQPRSSPNRRGRTTRTSGMAVGSTVNGTPTSSPGRRRPRAPGP